ncbi:MAG: PIN domain-containing protein [Verrucomicrobia bacterium]|nr:PIN domain-containing protein [Verrucomicrobiota bacterium]
MAAARIIIDAGPLVGYLDASDQWHAWSVEQFGRLPTPMLTCEAVLSEATYLLGGGQATEHVFEMIAAGALEIAPLFPQENASIRALIARYGERMQLADACLVRLSELHARSQVLTTDRADFAIYRRHRTERISLIAP